MKCGCWSKGNEFSEWCFHLFNKKLEVPGPTRGSPRIKAVSQGRSEWFTSRLLKGLYKTVRAQSHLDALGLQPCTGLDRRIFHCMSLSVIWICILEQVMGLASFFLLLNRMCRIKGLFLSELFRQFSSPPVTRFGRHHLGITGLCFFYSFACLFLTVCGF